jgi:S-adenosylmethionine-diacylglycerol 3-amino-3-carboxypropyl transferase
MDKDTFRNISQKIIAGLETGARMAYWNLMVPRRISAEFPGNVNFDENLSASLSQRDKGFFYDRFIVDVVK